MNQSDGHTALKQEIIEQATQDSVQVSLVRLIYGKDLSELTLHVAPASTSNLSATLVGDDLVRSLPMEIAECRFSSRGACGWKSLSNEVAAEEVAKAFVSALELLNKTDWRMRNELHLLMELPKPSTGSHLPASYLRPLGDGHASAEPPPSSERAEDDKFEYRLTYLRLTEHNAGNVMHLAPKTQLSDEEEAVLRMLGFQVFSECPEFDFEPCWWRSISNPKAGQRDVDFFERNRAVEDAVRAFRALPSNFPEMIDAVISAHGVLTAVGLPYLNLQRTSAIASTPAPQRRNLAGAKQVILSPRKPHDAYEVVRGMLTPAKRHVRLMDPYVDADVAAMLGIIPSTVRIEVLTRKIQGADGLVGFTKLAKQHGRTLVRVASTDELHDRFLEVDGVIFQLGASLNNLGDKLSMVSQVEDPNAVKQLRAEWERLWRAAQAAW